MVDAYSITTVSAGVLRTRLQTGFDSGYASRSMKVYNLSCEHHHCFEGWFSSEADFIEQSQSACIACPVCDNRVITKLPAAPRLNLSGNTNPQQREDMARLQAHLMKMVHEVIARTEDVGERFPEEARRIHYDEAPERAIRGTASVRECAELIEEGIEIMPLPLPKRHLQ